MGEPMPGAEYDVMVRAWAGRLREGATETWSEFLSSDTPWLVAEIGPLPGAAQLEVTRRLAAIGDLPDFESLADLVLGTAGPGRGLVDVPLPWPDHPTGTRIGTPPVAPEQLPADELLRVCAGVLATLLAAEPDPPVVRRARPWRPWRPSFTLLGAPGTVATVRAALLERGLREGGARTTWFVLGGPLEDLMTQRWSARVRSGAAMRWQRMWRTAAANDRLPPAIALPTIASHLADEFDAARVHVVLGEDATTSMAAVADVLGVSAGPMATRHDVLGTDLLRRVNPVLGLAVGDARRRAIVDRVWPEIAE
ncbi:MAG TPA: hypothetical protein VFE07_06595, partial [Marmoricola sp.]|nr:hypothetical protein [Marmoricola sp.]